MRLGEFLGETREQQTRTIRMVITATLIVLGVGAGVGIAGGGLEQVAANFTNRPPAARHGAGYPPAGYSQNATPSR